MQNVPFFWGLTMKGYSLLEMMIVVAILTIAAAIAVPAVTTPDHSKLDLAATRVADAMRYAREEARRTGVAHGAFVDITNNTLQLFRLDETPDPDVKVFDVRDPVSKQLYNIRIDAAPHNNVVAVAVNGTYSNICKDPGNILFDPRGVTRCADPLTTWVVDTSVNLQLGILKSTISVDGFTGRVEVE